MDNILELALQMVFCLLLAALLGAIIGYLLGKMSGCDEDDRNYDKNRERVLNDYSPTKDEYQAELLAKKSKKGKKAKLAATTAAAATGIAAAKDKIVDTSDDVKQTIKDVKNKKLELIKEDKNFVTGPGQEIGIKPSEIRTPHRDDIDDLKEISGIGLKIEEVLNSIGIYKFEQIAQWTPQNIEWIENYLTLKDRVYKEDWIGQAKLLAAGGQTEFSKKVRRGENRNYK